MDTVVTAMTTALTSVQGTVLGGLAAVAPVGLVVMGAFLTWKMGVRFFKGLAK